MFKKVENNYSALVNTMVMQSDNLEYDLLSDRNQNKYHVFEQVREFLDSNGIP